MAELVLDDTHLFYEEPVGEGPPLVLVNGLVMTTRHWGPQLALQDEFRLYRYDQRNQGRSAVASKVRYGELVDDLARFLDHHGLESPSICGISYGSIVAKEFAIRHPNRCHSLALVAPLCAFDPALRSVYAIWRALLRAGDMETFAASVTLLSYDRPWPALVEASFDKSLQVMAKHTTGAQVLALLDSFEPDDLGNYSEIQCPTLVVGALRDRIHPPNDARQIAAAIPAADLAMLDGSHAVTIDRAEEFNRVLREFLRSVKVQ